ncbi:hypothetical protein ADIS_2543 [Lunatimonas lonarensis]|uniref:Uncharacterized protein n=1 Tax=Lunatimonas lonarensis TaxID=1232681 RepID=R7ZSB7_9BACT|nr:hypothetical protein ADIS_2543 [Lunatimonas lonarensis]
MVERDRGWIKHATLQAGPSSPSNFTDSLFSSVQGLPRPEFRQLPFPH